jgi:hypothetical protein
MRTFLLVCLLLGLYRLPGQTFIETHPVGCGDTSYIGNLGYPSWNTARILKAPRLGHAVLLGDFIPANLLQYQAPPCVIARDTVIIECAHATQISCDTGVYIFDIQCPENIELVYPATLPCNDTLYIDNLSAWVLPTIVEGPSHGNAVIELGASDGAGIRYWPDADFEGLDAVKVSFAGGNGTFLYLFRVYCNLVSVPALHAELATSVWPNPAGKADRVFLCAAAGLRNWRLLDAQGRACAAAPTPTEGGYWLDLHGLPSGLYTLQARRADGAWLVCRLLR